MTHPTPTRSSTLLSTRRPSANNNLLTLMLLLLSAWLLVVPSACAQKVIQQMPQPRINTNKIPMNQYISQSNKLVSIGFPDVNFQISSQLYLTTNTLTEQQAFELSSYNMPVDQLCQLYPTNLETRTRDSLAYADNVEVLKYTMSHSDKKSRIYVLGSDSILYKYIFDQIQVKLSEQYPIDKSISKVKDEELSQNIQLFEIGGRLLIATNQTFYIFDGANIVNSFRVLDGYSPISNVLDIGVIVSDGNQYQINGTQIWVASSKGIYTYQFVNSNGVISMRKLSQITTVQPDAVYYDAKLQVFFVIQGHILKILNVNKDKQNQNKEFEIDGTCRGINKIKQSLYLICQYERINFITQIKVEVIPGAGIILTLNRYYDDNTLEGVRDVQPLGYDKIALIGDEEAMVIGEAINRNLLLDLDRSQREQNYDMVYSFGMIDFYYLDQYSTPQQSSVLVVSDTHLSLLNIQFVEPEVECVLNRDELGPNVNLLAVFNTTHCPYSINDPNTVGGLLVVCQTYYPYQIALGQREYEEKTAKFAFFVIMLIIVVLILVCAGWGVQIRNKANAMIANVRNKLEKIKRERQSSEIKKI